MRAGQGVAVIFTGAAAQSVVTFGLLAAYGSDHPQWDIWLLLSGGWFVFAAIAAAVVTLLPLMGLERRGWLSGWSALAVGVVDGLILTAVNALLGGFIDIGPVWHVLTNMELVSIAGALAGWGVWRLSQRRGKPEDAAQVF